MAGLLNLLGNTAGRAFKKYPIGAPVATGASLAALTGTLGNEESGWVGRNQGKVKDAFGFGLEQQVAKEREMENYFLKLKNPSDVSKKEIEEQLTYGYMYEEVHKDPHENNKFILELMNKYGFTEDHSESKEQRLGFWKEAVGKGYYKLKNPVYQKILLER